jgi:hypothetical protein
MNIRVVNEPYVSVAGGLKPPNVCLYKCFAFILLLLLSFPIITTTIIIIATTTTTIIIRSSETGNSGLAVGLILYFILNYIAYRVFEYNDAFAGGGIVLVVQCVPLPVPTTHPDPYLIITSFRTLDNNRLAYS